MPERSDIPILRRAAAFTLVEALLALGVASGALVLVSGGVGPLMRLAGEARILTAADRAAEAVMAEDARRRSRAQAGIAAISPGEGGHLPAGDGAAWWVDREGMMAAPVSEWRAGSGRLPESLPVFEVLAVGHRIEEDGGGPPRRSLVVGWPAVDARGAVLPWTERRRRVWLGVLSP
jgi:type II secretory pathway pseudopilin PulG